MIFAFYVAAVAGVVALLAGFVLYRRRKVRKPVYHGYCAYVVPPGGDPETDYIRIHYRKCPD